MEKASVAARDLRRCGECNVREHCPLAIDALGPEQKRRRSEELHGGLRGDPPLRDLLHLETALCQKMSRRLELNWLKQCIFNE